MAVVMPVFLTVVECCALAAGGGSGGECDGDGDDSQYLGLP